MTIDHWRHLKKETLVRFLIIMTNGVIISIPLHFSKSVSLNMQFLKQAFCDVIKGTDNSVIPNVHSKLFDPLIDTLFLYSSKHVKGPTKH